MNLSIVAVKDKDGKWSAPYIGHDLSAAVAELQKDRKDASEAYVFSNPISYKRRLNNAPTIVNRSSVTEKKPKRAAKSNKPSADKFLE